MDILHIGGFTGCLFSISYWWSTLVKGILHNMGKSLKTDVAPACCVGHRALGRSASQEHPHTNPVSDRGKMEARSLSVSHSMDLKPQERAIKKDREKERVDVRKK